jgi:hypothetical protein
MVTEPVKSVERRVALDAAQEGWGTSIRYMLIMVVTKLPWAAVLVLIASALGIVGPPVVQMLSSHAP